MGVSLARNAGILTALSALGVGLVLAPTTLAWAHPGPHDPYFIVYSSNGQLGCAAGALAVATDNLCPPCVAGNDHSTFRFAVPEGSRVAFAEVAWAPTTALGKELALTAPASLGSSATQRPEGGSPLQVTIQGPASGTQGAGTVVLTVGASHRPSLVLEQDFRMVVTVFVNMDMPAGYTGLD